jgi:thiol-disulfide isomerase/thioredoxin
MELVFVRIKDSEWCDKAEPFADTFAKENNFMLTKYVDEENIPEKYDEFKEYPVLFYLENSEIVGYVKGFSTNETQLRAYNAKLETIKNPELLNSTNTEG